MKLHGIDIEPGMIIETKDEFNRSHGYWVAVPTRMLEHSIVFVNAQYGGWTVRLGENTHYRISCIREPSSTTNFYDGNILWKEGMLIVTKKEIAIKFGIEESKLKIIE